MCRTSSSTTNLTFATAQADGLPTAVLTGVVTDPSGAAVPNVRVNAISTGTNLSRQAVTDESGTFRIAPLNPGPYRLEVLPDAGHWLPECHAGRVAHLVLEHVRSG